MTNTMWCFAPSGLVVIGMELIQGEAKGRHPMDLPALMTTATRLH